MAPSDKNSGAGKPPAKVETIVLKVLIHCEGCKKKVTKILQQIDGVQTVNVDARLGRVTVTGFVDSKILLKKLEKAGKFAELLAGAGPASERKGKDFQKDQPKGEKKENKKVRFQDADDGDKRHEWVKPAGKGDINNGAGIESVVRTSDGMVEQNVKTKKGGDGFGNVASSTTIVQRNIAPRVNEMSHFGDSTADYATHIFSDENTESCRIM